MRANLDDIRAHLAWILGSGAPGCVQLEQRSGGKTVRRFCASPDDAVSALDPDARNDVGVNPRPRDWAGSGWRECPEGSIETLSAIRIDIDHLRPLALATAEAIASELEADARKRAEDGKPALPGLPPVAASLAARAAARYSAETPGLLAGEPEHKAALRGAIASACSGFGIELRPELLDKLATCANRAAAGQPTSDAEHAATLEAGRRLASWALARGWSEPLIVDSGNGCHVWFPVGPVAVTGSNRDALKAGLSELERLCRAEVEADGSALRVDAWGGLAATTRLAGTLNTKGTATAERPHRMARIVSGSVRGDGSALLRFIETEGHRIVSERNEQLARRRAEAEARMSEAPGLEGTQPRNFEQRAEALIERQLAERPLSGVGHDDTLRGLLALASTVVRLGLSDYRARFRELVLDADPDHWTARQLDVEIEKALAKAEASGQFGALAREWIISDARARAERETQRGQRSRVGGIAAKESTMADAEYDWLDEQFPGLSKYDESDAEEQSQILDSVPLPDRADAGQSAPAGARDNVRKGPWGKTPEPPPERLPAPYAPDLLPDSFAAAIARARARADGKETPIRTPWRSLDNALGGGLWNGSHMLVAGSGVGKTMLTLQIAETAARAGVPIGLVELELDTTQLALRILTEHETARAAHVGWSNAYLGRVKEQQLSALEAAAQAMKALPIYSDFGGAMQWSSDRLRKLVQWMRAKHPAGPLLVVVDFLQLVGAPEGESKLDLRERIGRAAYQARQLAREFGATIVLVSSTSRANYEVLSGKLDKLGLRVRKTRFGGTRRVVLNPDAVIGLGKESGELEYAADSVTVLVRPQLTQGAYDNVIAELFERDGRPIVAITAKWRAGVPTWFALAHEQGRFSELPDDSINSLVPKEGESSGASAQSDPLTLIRAIVGVIAKAEGERAPLKNRTAVCERVSGRRQLTLEAIKQALREGYIRHADDGFRSSRCEPLPEAQPKLEPKPAHEAATVPSAGLLQHDNAEQGELDLDEGWLS